MTIDPTTSMLVTVRAVTTARQRIVVEDRYAASDRVSPGEPAAESPPAQPTAHELTLTTTFPRTCPDSRAANASAYCSKS